MNDHVKHRNAPLYSSSTNDCGSTTDEYFTLGDIKAFARSQNAYEREVFRNYRLAIIDLDPRGSYRIAAATLALRDALRGV